MPKRARKLVPMTGGRAERVKSKGSTEPSKASVRSDTALARERFVSDLLTRGEAATRDKSGKLPLGATHVIKKRKPGGSAEVERVRFKTF